MRKVMTCLLTITLFLPALARDRSASKPDCITSHTENNFILVLSSVCTAELINVTLNSKLEMRECPTEDGHTITKLHVQTHGTGVGVSSGNEYVINLQTRNFFISAPVCEISGTFLTRSALISKGPAPNERILLKSTLIRDSTCNVQMEEELEIDCQD